MASLRRLLSFGTIVAELQRTALRFPLPLACATAASPRNGDPVQAMILDGAPQGLPVRLYVTQLNGQLTAGQPDINGFGSFILIGRKRC